MAASASNFVRIAISVLVLLFLVPVYSSIVTEVQEDENVTGTTSLIVGFILTLFTLGILVWAADGLLGGAISDKVRGRS